MSDDPPAIRRLYTAAMLAELVGVNVAAVRAWQRRGWLVPADESHRLAYFDFEQAAVARQLAGLQRGGVSPRRIERQLAELRRTSPQIEHPLAELSWTVDGGQILVRHEQGWMEPGGQLRIDFDAATDDEESPVALVSPAAFFGRNEQGESATPEQLVAWALELEEAGDLTAASEMVRAALAAGGPKADLCFHLAEILYRMGDLAGARERYYMTLELEEDYVEALANLGCVLAEMNQGDLALAAFEGALQCHEPYPDVHYQLARLLDERGDAEEADLHWRRFLELAPDSPWADEARQRLGTGAGDWGLGAGDSPDET